MDLHLHLHRLLEVKLGTGFYLLDHPNPNGDHFYTTRRKKIKGQVMHITAGLEDIDLLGPDNSAEGVVRYAATTDREVSWHSSSDTDSYIYLLPYNYTAFQCINYNSSTAGHEISKLETNWTDDNPEVVKRRLIKAADAIRPNMLAYGIPFRKATKAELDHAIATDGPPVGLISHWELDPDRRSDPGLSHGVDTFPWDQFISILKDGTQPEKDGLDMADLADVEQAVRNVFNIQDSLQFPQGQVNNDKLALILVGHIDLALNGVTTVKSLISAVKASTDLQGDDEQKVLDALAVAEATIISALPDEPATVNPSTTVV